MRMGSTAIFDRVDGRWPACKFCGAGMIPDLSNQLYCRCQPAVRYVVDSDAKWHHVDLEMVGMDDLPDGESRAIPFYLTEETTLQRRVLLYLQQRGFQPPVDIELAVACEAVGEIDATAP